MTRVVAVAVSEVRMPLIEPYPSAITTIEALDALVVQVTLDDGSTGFGEAAIVEGYTHETRAGGWVFCMQHGARSIGLTVNEVKASLASFRATDSHAVSALVSAIEMAEGHPLLAPPDQDVRVPMLAPVNAKQEAAIGPEIERLLAAGFRTLKVKVGFEPVADGVRVKVIQRITAGRAKLRLDGNQGYSRAAALRFIETLDPAGIELFEQPCPDHDWASAEAVARLAPVPMMLDESIYASSDIDRAGKLGAARYIKLKLAKAGGLDALAADLERITSHGMQRVLGNGVATEIACWMEGCVARRYIDNAGEMNGYLKPRDRLFADRLPFTDGAMIIPRGYTPRIDDAKLAHVTVRHERWGQVWSLDCVVALRWLPVAVKGLAVRWPVRL